MFCKRIFCLKKSIFYLSREFCLPNFSWKRIEPDNMLLIGASVLPLLWGLKISAASLCRVDSPVYRTDTEQCLGAVLSQIE